MDREERIQFTAAIIASGLANRKAPGIDIEIALRAVEMALRIEAEGYGGYEPTETAAKRFAEEYAKLYGKRKEFEHENT